MRKHCGLCQKIKKCAMIEVSTYDPHGDTSLKFHQDVCAGCADLIAPVISAVVQSWCKEKRGRVAKLKNVKWVGPDYPKNR